MAGHPGLAPGGRKWADAAGDFARKTGGAVQRNRFRRRVRMAFLAEVESLAGPCLGGVGTPQPGPRRPLTRSASRTLKASFGWPCVVFRLGYPMNNRNVFFFVIGSIILLGGQFWLSSRYARTRPKAESSSQPRLRASPRKPLPRLAPAAPLPEASPPAD